jgi:ubiquinone/menaquinone biosynthesis C-methylase UbiE
MVVNPWWAPWMLNRVIEPLMKELRVQAPQLAGMQAGDTAVDICCGTGALALHYAGMGVIAAGIDMDPRVIEIADRKGRSLGLTNASFRVGNASALPFEDDSFDFASISMSLHETESTERDTIIAEMKRIVKGEGALIFIDYKVPLPLIPSSYTSRVVELVCGKEHNRCFRDYVRQGGLDGLLDRHGLHAEKRAELGPMWMIKAGKLIT